MYESSIISKYFPEVSSHQKEQFDALHKLYVDWNTKINVISRKDIDELYLRHVLHSLGIAKVVSFHSEANILDVGTGGGFPGIPLAILFPDCKFHLIDSIGKKIMVVQSVADSIGLKNVVAEKIRAEDLQNKYDFIVSRAVTKIGPFYQWIKQQFNKKSENDLKNGVFYLKGGDLSEELATSKLRYKLHDLSDFFEEEFFVTKKVLYVPHQ